MAFNSPEKHPTRLSGFLPDRKLCRFSCEVANFAEVMIESMIKSNDFKINCTLIYSK
jgi:hypothetical protein